MSRTARTCSILIVAAILESAGAGAATQAIPAWIKKFIASQPARSRTIIEESIYRGKRVFEILPGGRAPDSRNEHILRSEDGRLICEFGGFVGRVSFGACDINQIKFIRRIYPPTSNIR